MRRRRVLSGELRADVLLVHHLGARELRAAKAMLVAGGAVVCVSASQDAVRDVGGQVRVLREEALHDFAYGVTVDGAFDLIERGAQELARRRPAIVRFFTRVAGSADVDRYLCRCLVQDVGALVALGLLAASDELVRYGRVLVEPHWPRLRDLSFVAGLTVADGGRVSLPSSVSAGIARLVLAEPSRTRAVRMRVAGVLGAAREGVFLWGQCLRLLAPFRRLPRRSLLIRSYDWDWGFDRGGRPRLRNVDFLVDDRTIGRDEVGLWLEEGVPAERRLEAETRGYAAFSRADVGVGPLRFLRHFLPTLVRFTLLAAGLAAAEPWWHQLARRFVFQSLMWREVARQVRPHAFVAYNDYLPSAIARSLALRREGCVTVEYEFSSHWLTDSKGWIPNFVYAFSVVDAVVSWGALHSEHLARHRGAVREFWDVGCLWSEHARLVAEEEGPGTAFRQAVERAVGVPLAGFEAVVGVFDTSTASFFGPDDMAAFYAGVARLARQLPGTLFLCKPKRPLETVFRASALGPDAEATLMETPNVMILDTLFETAAVVGLADLSVNACFTSPAVESIGLGRPAVYYDPTGLFPRSFFRRIPGLVATGDEELAALVAELLAASGETRDRDLRDRFSALEGHFDGRAITRLRERLRSVLDS